MSSQHSNVDYDHIYESSPSKDEVERMAEQYDIKYEDWTDAYEELADMRYPLADRFDRFQDIFCSLVTDHVGETVDITTSNLGWRNADAHPLTGVPAENVLEKIIGSSTGSFTLYILIDDDDPDGRMIVRRTDHDSPTLEDANRFVLVPAGAAEQR